MTSSPVVARRLAILVHQRKNPTLPYQALASRESARLYERVCPLRFVGVLVTRDRSGYVRSFISDGVDGIMPTPSRASTRARISARGWGPFFLKARALRNLSPSGSASAACS